MNILLVEDNPDDAWFLQELLTEADAESFHLVHVARLSLALQQLREEPFDIVLLDFFLPDSQGIETVRRLREHTRDMPIVVMTGLNDAAIGRQLVEAGAQAYFVKGQTDDAALLHLLRDAIAQHRAR